MEVCTARGVFNLQLIQLSRAESQSLLSRKTCSSSLFKKSSFNAGLSFRKNKPLRSITSEETSTQITYIRDDEQEPDSGITAKVEDTPTSEEKRDSLNQPNELSREGSWIDDVRLSKLLEDLGIKLVYEETYSLLVLGGGAIVALWLAAAVVGAIDSIPVLPKVLELVGLGYTIWFISRYLIFKKNRDELVARIEEIKQQVLGSKEN